MEELSAKELTAYKKGEAKGGYLMAREILKSLRRVEDEIEVKLHEYEDRK